MAEKFYNFIGGDWAESRNGRTYSTRNPADTREMIGEFQDSGAEDVRSAIASAEKALHDWRMTPAPKRGDIIFKVWELLRARAEDFARSITREEGKPIRDASGEVKRSCNVLEFFSGEGRRIYGETVPSELPNKFACTIRRPLGVVSVISPWNFPLAIPVWKIAPALVYGNTVVFKPATSTPLTAVELVQLFAEAGLPPGVLNMVTGKGSALGDELVTNSAVKAVTFTGSTETGSRVYELGSKHQKRVQCEMGGKNAVLVFDDADLNSAVEGIVQGAFGSTGQRCTATSRLIVTKGVKDELLRRLLDRMKKLKVGNGLDSEVEVGPLSSESQMKKVLDYIEIGKAEGAKLVHGGGAPRGPQYEHGYYLEPTLFDEVKPEMRIAQEEIFGPVLPVITCTDFEDAVEKANRVRYGLSSSIYTSDVSKAFKFVERAEVGVVHVNAPTLGGEAHLPFGGVKGSGAGGREQGREAINFFTEPVTIYIDYSGALRQVKFI